MLKKRKFIKKLFDDSSVMVLKPDDFLSINNWEYKYKIWHDDYLMDYKYYYEESCKLMWELLDIALFCSQWWEDYDERIISFWEYDERFYIIFKWWVGCCGWNMAVDCVFEKSVGYNNSRCYDITEIFSWFYYVDTLDLVINILELLDRTYKELKRIKEKESYSMGFDKTEEEITEKKCTIIKNLWFWYQHLKRFKDVPKYINNLEPIVDLHANDEWKYPHIWTNFCFIWWWDQHIEI